MNNFWHRGECIVILLLLLLLLLLLFSLLLLLLLLLFLHYIFIKRPTSHSLTWLCTRMTSSPNLRACSLYVYLFIIFIIIFIFIIENINNKHYPLLKNLDTKPNDDGYFYQFFHYVAIFINYFQLLLSLLLLLSFP